MFRTFMNNLHSNANQVLTLGCYGTADKIIKLLEIKMKNIIISNNKSYAVLFNQFHGEFVIADSKTFRNNLAAAIASPNSGLDYAAYQHADAAKKSQIRDEIANALLNLINLQKNVSRSQLSRQRVYNRLDCEDHYLFSIPGQLNTAQGLLSGLESCFTDINNRFLLLSDSATAVIKLPHKV